MAADENHIIFGTSFIDIDNGMHLDPPLRLPSEGGQPTHFKISWNKLMTVLSKNSICLFITFLNRMSEITCPYSPEQVVVHTAEEHADKVILRREAFHIMVCLVSFAVPYNNILVLIIDNELSKNRLSKKCVLLFIVALFLWWIQSYNY
ncbi:hypothetical protein [Petrimonas sulfuriphila]|uniref:hypothetical protein n=1 Tax=Petrimonas sulfuriphila TaxID=285070 RepID=UPI003F51A5D6